MSEQVQVGIIGTSWWTDLMFLPSLISHPQARVAAICGRSRERAQEMADKYGVPAVFTDYRDLIKKGDLDAGLHVLCEKPLASNAEQARGMLDKAKAAGVKHMVLFTWRWMPHFQYLHNLVEDGYIGRPFHTKFSFQGGYGRGSDYLWRFDRQRANGIVGDLGSHMIDFARWFVGDIVEVSANLASFVERRGGDGQPLDPANDSAVVALKFANGAQGTIQVSAVANVGEHFMEQHLALYGEAGTLLADVFFGGGEGGAEIRGVKQDGEPLKTLPVPDELWGDVDRSDFDSAQMPGVFERHSAGPRLFIDAIVEDLPVSPNFYDGYKVCQVVDAALKSAETGRVVAINN